MSTEKSEPWVVLGDREHGVSWGPFDTQAEAEAFAGGSSQRIAIPLSGARSQIETCVAYGFDFEPLPPKENPA